MELPKFLLGDNTDFPEDIFVIHLDYPRFIINLKDDEVEFMEEDEDLDEAELNAEMEKNKQNYLELYKLEEELKDFHNKMLKDEMSSLVDFSKNLNWRNRAYNG